MTVSAPVLAQSTSAGPQTTNPLASGINALAQSIRTGEIQGAAVNASLANLAQSVGLAPKPPPPPASVSPIAIVVGVVAVILVGGLVVYLVRKGAK